MTREFLFLASIVLFHQRRFTGDMPILLADVGSSDRILANDFIAKRFTNRDSMFRCARVCLSPLRRPMDRQCGSGAVGSNLLSPRRN